MAVLLPASLMQRAGCLSVAADFIDGLMNAAISFVVALVICGGLTAVQRVHVLRWLFVGPRLLGRSAR